MKILITTPAPPRSRYGNRVTALRWARILKEIGHHVTVSQVYEDGDYDLLVALHARRSYPSINRWRHLHPDKPLIVALSGTDLYRDLKQSKVARESLDWPLALLRFNRKLSTICRRAFTRKRESSISQFIQYARAVPLVQTPTGIQTIWPAPAISRSA